MVTLDAGESKLARCVEVKPIFKDEKKKCVPITSCVNVKWRSPKRSDPFGVTMLEQVGPKQSAISKLVNLRLIDATFSTL